MSGLSVALDLFPLLAGVLAAVTCGVLGNFLVLRRISLMGDAISHSVLPGLVIAFLLTQSRAPLPMFFGAAAAGVATVVLVELVKRYGRVEAGAAMGVVFSVLFALGVLLIQRAASQVDLDADCVLHGQLEMLVWYDAPPSWAGVLSWETLRAVPRQVVVLGAMCAASFLFVGVLFKELRIAAFDPQLATTQSFNATLLHFALMIFVAAATVASFEAVGSILVIAMLICPGATARLLTDRLLPQIWWSVLAAVLAGVGGYFAASAIPGAFGKDSVNAAGSMTVAAGALLVVAIVASPRYGLVARLLRRRALARRIVLDDLLAAIYRAEEGAASGGGRRPAPVAADRFPARVVRVAARQGLVRQDGPSLSLAEPGRVRAEQVVRRHRLWESYLVERAGFPPDHVHEPAEILEHLASGPDRGPSEDPHGRPIPPPGA